MSQQTFSLIAGLVFLVVALVHVARILGGWDIVIAGHQVAMWVSWVGLVVTGALAYYGLRYAMRP